MNKIPKFTTDYIQRMGARDPEIFVLAADAEHAIQKMGEDCYNLAVSDCIAELQSLLVTDPFPGDEFNDGVAAGVKALLTLLEKP